MNKPGSQEKAPVKPIGYNEPIWSQRTLGFNGIAKLMLKSSLFILICKTDADFHQMATFILWLAVYSRHTVSFSGPHLFM